VTLEFSTSSRGLADIEDDIKDIMFPERSEDDFDEDDISHDNGDDY
jgi:hypothetical protein